MTERIEGYYKAGSQDAFFIGRTPEFREFYHFYRSLDSQDLGAPFKAEGVMSWYAIECKNLQIEIIRHFVTKDRAGIPRRIYVRVADGPLLDEQGYRNFDHSIASFNLLENGMTIFVADAEKARAIGVVPQSDPAGQSFPMVNQISALRTFIEEHLATQSTDLTSNH